MNIQEYISSGILEAYALGDLSEAEKLEVEKNLDQYPELKNELTKIEQSQESLLRLTAISPRASLKDELFEKLNYPQKEKLSVDTSSTLRLAPWKFAVAASLTIALIASYLAYEYWNRWKQAEANAEELITQNERITDEYNQLSEQLSKIENDLAVIGNPEFQRIVMEGTANAPEAMAYVYWNVSTEEVYLEIKNLSELTQQNQYQLWAIIDGKPVDAGVFNVDDAETLIKMKHVPIGATVFAVTVEPRGGRKTPTMETMQVAGDVERG